ncbi:unnamed protein product [Adineta ricciae]|uniref:Uncharacterized protein n=1 Tax=Adineta ricciae TaxID=249248 RepID=A0A813ZHA1_ADIRI|nr:unnamed protein product [Adineta ricciae]
MTFSDMLTTSPKSFRCSSVSNQLNQTNQQGKLKRLNTSILNLISRSQQIDSSKKLNTNAQLAKQQVFLHPPSALSRSISNKSVTFALVFDEMDIPTKEPEANEDSILVVPNKYVTKGNDANIEPYPFRSEIPFDCLIKSNSSTNIIDCHEPKKKFLNFHRQKKVRHPIEVSSINRSTSVPVINEQQQQQKSSKKISPYRRMKFSSFTRFLQSFAKHSNDHPKSKSSIKPTTFRKYSEMFY